MLEKALNETTRKGLFEDVISKLLEKKSFFFTLTVKTFTFAVNATVMIS